MSDPKPALTMREIREQLGHVELGQPEVLVSITRYTVSVLPADDINHRYFALYVELRPDGWIVTTGHEYYTAAGTWEPGMSVAHRFADYDDALSVAKARAPHLRVMAHTAVDAWRRTHPSP